jgi:hypothetical protein
MSENWSRADKMAFADVTSLEVGQEAHEGKRDAATLRLIKTLRPRLRRTEYAGSWDVGRASGIPVRMSRRPNAFQQFVAKHVLGFEWIDAE